MAVKRPPRGASYQPKHITQPLAYWRQRGLQMVFLGNRCVWNRDDQASGDPPTVVGGPKNNTGPYGVAQGFGPTYGTGLTDYLGGNKLRPPKTGGRSILSFFYAKTTGGGGLGRVYQDASGSGLTVGESFYISTTPGVTFAFTDASSTINSTWTPSFTVPTGRWCSVGIAVPFLPVASTARAFLDGKFIASAANASGVSTGANAPTNMTWGNRAAAPGNERQFDGMLGPTLIFDGVLDDRDFADLSANPWRVFPETQRRRIPATGGTPTLTVADAAHGHAADNLVLTSSTDLVIAEATHGHAADNLTLDAPTGTSLTVADATHAHTADALTLSTDAWLAVADALHGHAADNLTLDTAPALAIADAVHAHAADSLSLTLDSTLAIQDALHEQSADNLTIATDGEPEAVVSLGGPAKHRHYDTIPRWTVECRLDITDDDDTLHAATVASRLPPAVARLFVEDEADLLASTCTALFKPVTLTRHDAPDDQQFADLDAELQLVLDASIMSPHQLLRSMKVLAHALKTRAKEAA